jgi:hypothetical protein
MEIWALSTRFLVLVQAFKSVVFVATDFLEKIKHNEDYRTK